MLAGGGFLAVGSAVLGAGHPHEDAYILYRYAENLALGRGIVFNASGPPAEGATDFLWLVGIAGLVRMGLDVAFAALWLNALGVALGTLVIARIALAAGRPPLEDRAGRDAVNAVALGARSPRPPAATLVCVVAATASLLLYAGAMSAYVGFSTSLYAALAGVGVALLCDPDPRARLGLPALALVLGLLRPDGLLIGASFALVGARGLGARRRAYGLGLAACAGLGAVYFVGRALYFGELLPLPLYVKSHANVPLEAWAVAPRPLRPILARMQGVEPTLRWLMAGQGPTPLLLGLAALAGLARARERSAVRTVAFSLVPGAVLLAALAWSWQSQNVAFRFQAPVTLMLVLALLVLATRVVASAPSAGPRRLAALSVVAALAPSLYYGARTVARLLGTGEREYVEIYAPALGAQLGPEDVVALTEAGRLSFYTDARIEDLAGLNSPRAARTPPGLEQLEALDPTVVHYHHGSVLDLGAVARARGERDVLRLSPDELREAVRPEYRDLYDRSLSSYADSGGRAHLVAAGVLTRFLVESQAYAILAVDYRGSGRFDHVYGLHRDRLRADEEEATLRAARDLRGYRSYRDLAQHAGRARRDAFAEQLVESIRAGSDALTRYASSRDVRRMRALRPRIGSAFQVVERRHTPLGPFEYLLRFANGERGALFVTERAREVVRAELVLYPVERSG